MRRNTLGTLVLSALLPLVAGCQHIKTPVVAFSDDGQYLQPTVGEGLVADPDSFIPDVPMPVGFRAVASQCTSSFDGRARTVHHVYQGHTRPGNSAAFYQDTLPEYAWQFVEARNVSDKTTLTFTKGGETLTVQTRHSMGVSTVTIQISPR